MKIKKKLKEKYNDSDLTNDQLDHLLLGHTFIGATKPDYGKMGYPFKSKQHRERCWKQNKEYIMSLMGEPKDDLCFSGRTFMPGTRPQAWWLYDAPEPRRILKVYPDTVDKEQAIKYCEKLMEQMGKNRMASFGAISIIAGCHGFKHESEFSYLKRLGLLLPGEEGIEEPEQSMMPEYDERFSDQ